jgi:hypothetical protein
MSSNKGNGLGIKYIREIAEYEGDDCVLWPFSKTRGYGHLGYLGERLYAHRFMCELIHGPAPSDIHEAAHSCGNESCITPRHLSWKTPTENALDCRLHGTSVRSRYGNAGKITSEQAATIRGLKDIQPMREIAAEYGISESAVSNIWVGKTHTGKRTLVNFTPEQDARIREAIELGYSFRQMAAHVGRSKISVMTRTYRLGLKSGVERWSGNWSSKKVTA